MRGRESQSVHLAHPVGQGARVLVSCRPTACLSKFCEFTHSPQARAKRFQQRAEFLLLRNRTLSPLAVTVLPVPPARRAAATPGAAVQSTAPLFRRG